MCRPMEKKGGPGTAEKPFRTFAHAARKLSPGDTLIVHEGRYTEPLALRNKGGKDPIVVKAAEGEKVVFDGTDLLVDLDWEALENGIYRARLEEPVSQLFADDLMMTPARWPNAHMTDENFFRIKETNRMVVMGNSPLGRITDARPRNGMSTPVDESHFSESAAIRDDVNLTSLADLGFSVEGAVAVMNIGSWMNFASRVTHHEPGSNTFQYDEDFSEAGERMQRIASFLGPDKKFYRFLYTRYWHPHYYFLEGRALLDTGREYWYELSEKTLYYKPDGGLHPSSQALRGKRRSYMLTIDSCQNVHVQGIDFFGGTFRIVNSRDSSVQDSDLYSPTWNEFQTGNLGFFPETIVRNKYSYEATDPMMNNRVVNCRFSHLDGIGIDMSGKGNVLQNCLFHDLQYSNLGFAVGLKLNRGIALNNTLYRSGAPEGFRDGMIRDLNRVWDIGGLTHDGSCFQLGGVKTGTSPTIIRNNWVHDTSKIAYRYDAGRGVEFANALGLMCNNVSWNTRGMQIKGDDHMVLNNTILGDKGLNLSTADHWMSTNDRTITANNLLALIDGAPEKRNDPPGILLSNRILEAPGSLLRDPVNLDFRPSSESDLSASGTLIPFEQAPTGYRESFFNLYYQTDPMYVGAYVANSDYYSIPGFRTAEASTPVPPCGSNTVKPDADLMWLSGYKAVASKVYYGDSKVAVGNADESSPEYKGTVTGNVFDPANAQMPVGSRQFWRIDSVREDGTLVKGPVWSFQVDDGKAGEIVAHREPRLLECRKGDPVIVDGILSDGEWPQLADPAQMNAVHYFGDPAEKQVADFAVHHDDRHLYLLARIPDLGRVVSAAEGPNYEGFHTAWEVHMKWDNETGPDSPRTFKIAVFPDGSVDANIAGLGAAAAKRFFAGKNQPMTYAVHRQENSMVVEMQFTLPVIKRFFKSESNRIYFNAAIVVDTLPAVWAAPADDYVDIRKDGVLILADDPS